MILLNFLLYKIMKRERERNVEDLRIYWGISDWIIQTEKENSKEINDH